MAIIQIDRPVRRRVLSTSGKALVATMMPEGIYMREKRKRTAYLVPWGHVFVQGAKLAADRRRADRLAERAARKRNGKPRRKGGR